MKPYYKDDYITLYHGDCQKIIPFLGSFDLLLTDPPYGIKENAHRVASRSKLAKTTDYGSFDWDSSPPKKELLDQCVSVSKQAIIWGGNYFHLPPSKCWLVWDKQNSGGFADCELAWSNLPMAVRIFRFMWNGMIRQGEARGIKRVHPTQKPVELMQWCISKIKNVSTILDPFAGSGTTGRAAKNLRLKCTLIEKEEKYCKIIIERMRQEVLPL